MSWFKTHRGWMDDPDFKATVYTEQMAWMWIIESAYFKDNGKAKRGQFHAAQNFMANKFGWNRSKLRRFLKKLERVGKADHQTDHQTDPPMTIITICNYNKYQGTKEEADHQTDHQTDHKYKKGLRRLKNTTDTNVSVGPDFLKEFWNLSSVAAKKGITKSLMGRLIQSCSPPEAIDLLTRSMEMDAPPGYLAAAIRNMVTIPDVRTHDPDNF